MLGGIYGIVVSLIFGHFGLGCFLDFGTSGVTLFVFVICLVLV